MQKDANIQNEKKVAAKSNKTKYSFVQVRKNVAEKVEEFMKESMRPKINAYELLIRLGLEQVEKVKKEIPVTLIHAPYER